MSAERRLATDLRATVTDVLSGLVHTNSPEDHQPRTRRHAATLKQGCDTTWGVIQASDKLVITREMFVELEVAEIPSPDAGRGEAVGFSYTIYKPVLEDGIPGTKGVIDLSRTVRTVNEQATGQIRQLVSGLRRVPRR